MKNWVMGQPSTVMGQIGTFIACFISVLQVHK